jgi:hypothetical protein
MPFRTPGRAPTRSRLGLELSDEAIRRFGSA